VSQPGFSCYRGAGTRLSWNEWDTGISEWKLSEVLNGRYVLYHIFVTTGYDDALFSIMGQQTYINITAARAGAAEEISSLLLGTLPTPEIRPIGTVIYQTGNTYGNIVNAKIVLTDEGENYVDWRTNELPRGSAPTDHGNLTGLGDDDHVQYLLVNGSRALSADWDAGANKITAETFESDVSTGTAPLTIASTTVVTNLNSDLLDGKHSTDFSLVDGTQAYTGIVQYNDDKVFTNDKDIIAKKYVDDAISGLTTEHNSLTGLQGGSAGEYFHLTSTGAANSHSPYVIGTKVVDETLIGNNKVLTYNTSTGKIIYQSGGGGGSEDKIHVESFTVTSTGTSTGWTVFELDATPIGAEYVTISINGILQDSSFYTIAGNTLTLLPGAGSQLTLDGGTIPNQLPLVGDKIRVQILEALTFVAFDPLSVASLVDNTIHGSKLIDRSVQGIKLELGAVTDDELADDSVNLNKLALGGTSSQYLRGNDTLGNTAEFANAFYDQTIAGVKTFSSFPVTPSSDPSTAYQVANKQYVDNFINYMVASSTGDVNLIGIDPLQTTITEGMIFHVKLRTTNTSTSVEIKDMTTLFTYTLKRPTPSGLTTIPIGSLYTGNVISILYDGTYFQVVAGLPAIWE